MIDQTADFVDFSCVARSPIINPVSLPEAHGTLHIAFEKIGSRCQSNLSTKDCHACCGVYKQVAELFFAVVEPAID